MLEGDQIFSMISLVTAAIAILVGIYIINQGRRSIELRTAFLVTLFFSIGAVLDFLLNNAGNKYAALIIGKMVIFMAEMVVGMFFFLALMQLPTELGKKVSQRKGQIVALIIVIAFFAGLSIQVVSKDDYGWAVSPSFGLNLSIVLYIFYMVATIVVLEYGYRRSQDRQYRKRVFWMAVASTMPIAYGMGTVVVEGISSITIPRLLVPGFTLMVLIMAYAVVRYKLFIIVPLVNEDVAVKRGPTQNISPMVLGKSYMVEDRELGLGAQGLIITREHPDMVREKNKINTIPIIWLTSQPGPGRIEPTNLSIMQHTITEFLQKSENPVILLDGLEFLISNNKQEKVLQMVMVLRDEMMLCSGKFLLPVDPRTMDLRSLAFFERDFEVLKIDQ
jgi:hypothetical protein